MINVSEIVESKGEDYCTTILGLNMFIREDVTSSFKGKAGPLVKLHNITSIRA